jgi:hypothetical protein
MFRIAFSRFLPSPVASRKKCAPAALYRHKPLAGQARRWSAHHAASCPVQNPSTGTDNYVRCNEHQNQRAAGKRSAPPQLPSTDVPLLEQQQIADCEERLRGVSNCPRPPNAQTHREQLDEREFTVIAWTHASAQMH